jgi:hypothetical protein
VLCFQRCSILFPTLQRLFSLAWSLLQQKVRIFVPATTVFPVLLPVTGRFALLVFVICFLVVPLYNLLSDAFDASLAMLKIYK